MLNMKDCFIYTIFIWLLIINIGCTAEFKNGTSDIDEWNDGDTIDYVFNHPCLLHTNADFERVKTKLQSNAQPWLMGYEKLVASPRAQKNYQPSPEEKVERPGQEKYRIFSENGAAAYQLALMWKITGDNDYADASIRVLNSWAKKNKVLGGNDEKVLLAGFGGYQYANAAELMRDYAGWQHDDFEIFKQWLLSVVYPVCYDWMANHYGNPANKAWMSWDLPAMTSTLAIGIFTEDREKINYVLDYFYNGGGGGCIKNSVIARLEDPIGNIEGKHLAQSMEVGRDQGHATLNVPLLAYFCQMFLNVGVDLFSYDDHVVLDICEYIAKYNVSPNEAIDMPFVRYYTNLEGWKEVISQNDNDQGRGRARPGWELIYNHYKKKANPYYSREFARTMRPEGGGNRGGAEPDDMGFGTLMYTVDPVETGEDQAADPWRPY